MKKELMIDIETLDVTPNAVVLSIGALSFTQEEGVIGDSFYSLVDIDDQMKWGRSISQDTLAWWMDQEDRVRNEAFGFQRFHPNVVIKDLATFAKNHETIWANGPMFDIIIIESLARDGDVFNFLPWKFYQTRDLRTLREEAGMDRRWQPDTIPEQFDYGRHHPLTDCYIQIEAVRTARQMLPLVGM